MKYSFHQMWFRRTNRHSRESESSAEIDVKINSEQGRCDGN